MEKKVTISFKKQLVCLLVAVLTASFSIINAQVTLAGAWVAGATHANEAGSNRALVVLLHSENGNTTDVTTSGVTYGGQAMTKVGETSITNGSFYSYTGAYVLNNVGITAATSDAIQVTWNPVSPGGTLIESAFFVNVNQNPLVGASATNAVTNIGAIAISELTNTAGDMIIVSETASGSGFFSYDNTSFIKAYEQDNATAIGGIGAGYMQATGVAVTPSLTIGSQPRLAMQGFVLRKSSGTTDNEIITSKLLSIYPNPVSDKMIIDLQGDNSQKEVKIFNSIGKEIYSANTNSTSLNVDVKSLNYKGVALVKVVSNNIMRSQKLIVE